MKINRKILSVAAFPVLMAVHSVGAQGFTDTFTASEGYTTEAEGTIGSALSGQNGWATNDPFNPVTEAGEVNFVEFVAGTPNNVTPGSYAAGNYSGIIGGIHTNTTDQFYPARIDSEISKDFVAITPTVAKPSALLSVDFLIANPNDTNPALDTFGFDLRNSTNDSLAKFAFNPSGGLSGADLDFEWTLNSSVQTTANASLNGNNGIDYGAKYRLEALVFGSKLYVSISSLNAATNAVVATASIIQNGAISGSLATSDFSRFATTWDLADTSTTTPGVFENAGDNFIALNAVSVTAVPEPSTVAVITVLSLVGLAVRRYRRNVA